MRVRRRLLTPLTGGAILTLSALVLCAEPLDAQVASPLQSGHYAPGLVNIRDFAAPPPGLFVIWYNWFVSSGTYVDRDGNELTRLNLSQIDPSLPDVDVDLQLNGFATVPSLFWASTFTLLGGARYMAGVSPNWMTSDYTFAAEPGGPGFGSSDPETLEGKRFRSERPVRGACRSFVGTRSIRFHVLLRLHGAHGQVHDGSGR